MAKTVSDEQSKTLASLNNNTTIHVLHVDDDKNCLITTKMELEKTGLFEVDYALSVKEAYNLLEQKQYDVIISEYIMPERNGLMFLKQLRNDGNDLPFVLFTDTNRKEVLVEALNLGAYRYFNKNEKPDTLFLELVHSLKLAKVITDSKKAEIKLKESEAKFRAITSSAQDGIILLNNKEEISYWNPASEKIFGYTRKEAIGKNLHMLLAPKQFHDKILKGFKRFRETGKGKAIGKTLELEGVNKEGKSIPIEISLSSLKLKNKWYALALVRDNSERKAAWTSLEETINELVKINEKLGVVGRLTRHDARNKLTVILNNIFLAKKILSEDREALRYLRSIDSAVDQMKEIFEFARAYEMVGIEELTYSKAEKSFSEAAALLSGLDNIQMTNELTNLSVLADSLLRQLFYNLLQNSISHGKNVKQIRIYFKENPNQIQLIYEDNGIGIPVEEKQKIFDEGYGKGTGYGLYLIQKICENYGWTIHEAGIPGTGVKFVMSLPKTDNSGKHLYYFDD